MDEKDVRITADNLTYSAYQTAMDLLIENNSDQDLSVISGSIGFRVKTSDYQDYLTIDPVKIKISAASSHDLSEDTYRKAISDGTFEAVRGKNNCIPDRRLFFIRWDPPCFCRTGEQRKLLQLHRSAEARHQL